MYEQVAKKKKIIKFSVDQILHIDAYNYMTIYRVFF